MHDNKNGEEVLLAVETKQLIGTVKLSGVEEQMGLCSLSAQVFLEPWKELMKQPGTWRKLRCRREETLSNSGGVKEECEF